MIADTIEKNPPPDRLNTQASLSRSPTLWLVMALWGGAVAILSHAGAFDAPSGAIPVAVVMAALTPGILFITAYSASRRMRDWVERLDLAEIIALQAWRIIGFAFLIVWGLGVLPAIFALPAGIGDVAVGLAAPAVALQVVRRTPQWRLSAYGLTAAGIADFIIAFATGIFSREGAALNFADATPSSLLGQWPLALFPAFIVPAFIILHIIALIKLRET